MKFAGCLLLVLGLFIRNACAAEDVIGYVYETLNRDYINQADNKEITLKGLDCLHKTDADIRLSPTGDRLYFYYKRRLSHAFALPQDADNIGAWKRLSEDVIDYAIKISPKAELIDFELPDRFADAVFAGLDGYSHYYGAFSGAGGKKRVIRRHFASRTEDDVLIIKILSFRENVSAEVLDAVEKCEKCQGVILDLRGNHGGILNEALKITDMFLDEGIITYTAGKNGEAPHYYTSSAGDVINNKPLVVLVDGYTASAAEVLAGALSEQNRATLIGTETYGKGTVQDVIRMDGERAMAVTVSYFYTPSGVKIDQKGLNPAICTGGLSSVSEIGHGDCAKADRFNQELEIAAAVKFIKNEL